MRSARGIVLAELLVGCSVTAEEPVTTAPAATTADPTPVVTVTVVETVTPSPDPTPAAEATSPNVRNYVAPDPAYVAQFLKAEFRERLDREPDQDELNWHIEWFMAEDREGGDTEARWGQMFEQEYANELAFIRERERTRKMHDSVDDTVDLGSCMSNPDQARCDD